ncbi:MAG: Smr/MutS family protein [Daejeonella sp.]
MMRFKLGEFVRFVEERREGYITRIIDHQTIAVTDEDGFEIPVLTSQVTRIHGQSTEENDNLPDIPEKPVNFIDKGIFMAISGDKRIASVVHFHLVNTSSFQLLASLTTERSNKFKGEFSGIIKPGSSVQMYSASLNELDQWPKFHLQVILYSPESTQLKNPIQFSEKFRAKDLSGSKKHSSYLEQPAWLIQLDSDEPIIDVQALKESFHKSSAVKLEITNPGKEIDLHIEKLRDDHQFLSNSEILSIQLAHFRKSLDAAIVHKLPSIIFIHGSGNGTLRNEVHKVVSKHAQVKTFMDAYKERFGYGATEVVLK